MSFKEQEVMHLLVDTGRHCCICKILHRVSVHHIIPVNEGGTDDIDNAIPLCPLCHDEVHTTYAPGRVTKSYTPQELKLHRERTIEMVQRLPTEVSQPTASLATSQGVHASEASKEAARNTLRLTLQLRDLILAARVPFFSDNEAASGRRILQAASLPSDGKSNLELAWHHRWNPIRGANAELSRESLEAEIFFGAEARELVWALQLLVGHFGIDLDMYIQLNSQEARGPDPVREQFYKSVYNVAASADTDEFELRVKAAVAGIEGYMRPRL